MNDSALAISESPTQLNSFGATIYKLRSDEVMRYWAIIELAIREAHVPTSYPSDAAITKLQEDLVHGAAEAWIGTAEDGHPCAVAVITFLIESTGEKNALVYALYGVENLSIQLFGLWAQAFLDHFKRRGFSKLLAYTNQTELINMSKRLGAVAEFMLLEWRLQNA